MNHKLILLITVIFLFTACEKDNEIQQIDTEFTTIHDLTKEEATEILRHTVLNEYGGVFRVLKLYHQEVRVDGVECDTTLSLQLMDESPSNFTFSADVDLTTDCTQGWGVYNNRFYIGYVQNGTHTTSSDVFDLEMNVQDDFTIAGNFEDNKYTYNHSVTRDILITKGLSAELDPKAYLFMLFPNCTYNNETLEINEITAISFNLSIRTKEGEYNFTEMENKGTIEMIDNNWTAIYEDGSMIIL